MKTKTFDCVEMKRKGAECVRRRLRGASASQELTYWRTRTERLRAEQEAVRARTEKALVH